MLERLREDFINHFSHAPDHVIRAPGRVNLIGEHTDYNEGFVLPCAIDYSTLVAISPREDSLFKVIALDCNGETDSFDISQPIVFRQDRMWSNYIRGVVNELLGRQHRLRGCNLAITGNVPQGAGLSSSASLEVGLAHAIATVSAISLDHLALAKIGQAAENDFVGCACGIMDQLISASGVKDHAVAIDCRTYELTPVAVPEHLSILMINSNVVRGLVDSEYNSRRQQCESAAHYFNAGSLRDVSIARFEQEKHLLEPVIARRAQHVLEENRRTLAAIDALRDNDTARLSALMAESHHSMKELFEITVPEIDFLVSIISATIGDQGGVRMTGGGFGGCVVALLPETMVDDVIAVVNKRYRQHTGRQETIYLSRPAQGVEVVF